MNYISNQFNIQQIPSYTLLINAGFVKDLLAVVDQQNELRVFMEYAAEKPEPEAMKILSLPFKRVKVVIPHESFSFIPTELFEEEKLPVYASYLSDENPSHVYFQQIDALGVTVVYQFDLLLLNRWKSIFPNCQIIPEFRMVLEQVQSKIPIHGHILGVHYSNQLVDIYLFVNGQIQVYNSFEISSIDDLSYYILNIYNQFNIEGKVDKIIVSGLTISEAHAERLSQYGQQLERVELSTNIQVPADAEGLDLTQFHITFDALSCE